MGQLLGALNDACEAADQDVGDALAVESGEIA
jgi:hypothetical protein